MQISLRMGKPCLLPVFGSRPRAFLTPSSNTPTKRPDWSRPAGLWSRGPIATERRTTIFSDRSKAKGDLCCQGAKRNSATNVQRSKDFGRGGKLEGAANDVTGGSGSAVFDYHADPQGRVRGLDLQQFGAGQGLRE